MGGRTTSSSDIVEINMLHVESRCRCCPLSTLLTFIAYESSYLGDFKQAFYKLLPFILFHQYGRLSLNHVVIIKKYCFYRLFCIILSSIIKAVDYCRHDIGLKPSLVICNVPVLRRFVYPIASSWTICLLLQTYKSTGLLQSQTRP